MQAENKASENIKAIPPANEVRSELATKLREVQILRRLLRLSESVAKASRAEADAR